MKSKQRKRLNKLRASRREGRELSRLLNRIFAAEWSREPTTPTETFTIGIIPWIKKIQAEDMNL